MTRDRDFLHLLVAESISRSGDAVTLVAIPLTAILALDATPVEVGLLGAAQLLPIVALGLPAGAWVDRLRSRRRVMVAADIGRAVVLATVPLAWVSGTLTLGHLLLVVALNAALGTFFDVALASYVPILVGRDRLIVAHARLELIRSAAQVLGPGAAGLVMRFVAAPIVLTLDAISFLASGLLIATSPGTEPSPTTTPASLGTRGALRRELLAGVRLAVSEPHLRAITATAMTNNLSRSIGMVAAVLYLVREADVPADAVGLGFAVGNSGFVVGALIATRVSGALGIGRAMRFGVGLFWPGMLLLGLAPAEFALPAFTLMLFMNGLGIAVHNVNQVSVRQAVTPHRLLARVAAASRLLILGALPAGTLIGGILGTAIGFQNTLLVSAFGLFLGGVPYTVSRVRSLRALPSEAVVAWA
jgi:MFS family permease